MTDKDYYYSSSGKWFPLVLSCIAGASTCIGAAVVFCYRRPPAAKSKTKSKSKVVVVSHSVLSFSLALAGSVMVTVSVISIGPECLTMNTTSQKEDSDNVSTLFMKMVLERFLFFFVGCFGYYCLSKCAFPEPQDVLFLQQQPLQQQPSYDEQYDENYNNEDELLLGPKSLSNEFDFETINNNNNNNNNHHHHDLEMQQVLYNGNKTKNTDDGKQKQQEQKQKQHDFPQKSQPEQQQQQQQQQQQKQQQQQLGRRNSGNTMKIKSSSNGKNNNNDGNIINKSLVSFSKWTRGGDLETKEKRRAWRVSMLLFVSLLFHNFPEGLAVAASTMESKKLGITVTISIMLHNIPEGIVIAMPCLAARPHQPWLAFLLASLSGLAEPAGAFCAILVLSGSSSGSTSGSDTGNWWSMQNILSLVAGIMITVALMDLFPEAWRYTKAAGSSNSNNGGGSSNNNNSNNNNSNNNNNKITPQACFWGGTLLGVLVIVLTELYVP